MPNARGVVVVCGLSLFAMILFGCARKESAPGCVDVADQASTRARVRLLNGDYKGAKLAYSAAADALERCVTEHPSQGVKPAIIQLAELRTLAGVSATRANEPNDAERSLTSAKSTIEKVHVLGTTPVSVQDDAFEARQTIDIAMLEARAWICIHPMEVDEIAERSVSQHQWYKAAVSQAQGARSIEQCVSDNHLEANAVAAIDATDLLISSAEHFKESGDAAMAREVARHALAVLGRVREVGLPIVLKAQALGDHHTIEQML